MVRSGQRVRAKRGPMTGSGASRTMRPQSGLILRDARERAPQDEGLLLLLLLHERVHVLDGVGKVLLEFLHHGRG
jgi:hypothetical protein